MWMVIRRLLFGFSLILLVSAILLISDRHQRTAVGGKLPQVASIFKVGLVYFAPEPGADACMEGLFSGLKDLGFVEGKNLRVRKAHAQAEIVNIPSILQNFDNEDVELIIAMTTPVLTAGCQSGEEETRGVYLRL